MHKIPDSTIMAIRSGKQTGQSLKQISEQYHISKATVSYYCRDLFSHPNRKYITEVEIRKRGTELAKRFTCHICGTPTKSKNRLCGACYQRSRPQSTIQHPKKHKLYPCRDCKTKLISKPNGLCISCHTMLLAEQKAIQDKDKEQRQSNRNAYLAKLDSKANELAKCFASPTGAHYWSINADNIGTCKYCHKQKDMTTNAVLSDTTVPNTITERTNSMVLSLEERYYQAWCRITASLIHKGLSINDLLIVCNRNNLLKLKPTKYKVLSLEKEAISCPPVPQDIQQCLKQYNENYEEGKDDT